MDGTLHYYDDWTPKGETPIWLVLDSDWTFQTNLRQEDITNKLEKGTKVEYDIINISTDTENNNPIFVAKIVKTK